MKNIMIFIFGAFIGYAVSGIHPKAYAEKTSYHSSVEQQQYNTSTTLQGPLSTFKSTTPSPVVGNTNDMPIAPSSSLSSNSGSTMQLDFAGMFSSGTTNGGGSRQGAIISNGAELNINVNKKRSQDIQIAQAMQQIPNLPLISQMSLQSTKAASKVVSENSYSPRNENFSTISQSNTADRLRDFNTQTSFSPGNSGTGEVAVITMTQPVGDGLVLLVVFSLLFGVFKARKMLR
ncbi:hypothetical protein D0T49_04995 [Paludibacter sp. 221]|uniref:hypothetical protein n=1 Tax=Paludibacter sp. 221 TaxID=2302939 RepID=UPI0013D04315|nr:hypothetical protein [Paludibacter sp. 221]NDV46396.1 hypothetical protein [Paludibacter sp. 221]